MKQKIIILSVLLLVITSLTAQDTAPVASTSTITTVGYDKPIYDTAELAQVAPQSPETIFKDQDRTHDIAELAQVAPSSEDIFEKYHDISALSEVAPYTTTQNVTQLHKLAKKGRAQQVIKFIAKNKDIIPDIIDNQDKKGNTALHWAVKSHNYPVVVILLNYNANPNITNNKGNTPLHLAIHKYGANNRVISLLLKAGANIHLKNKKGESPVDKAIKLRSVFIVNMFLKKDPLITSLYSGLSLLATKKGDLTLLQQPFDINFKDRKGRTPLHHAIIENQGKIAQALIERGAEVNAVDKNGMTPLYFAARDGNVKLAKLLLENGARVDIVANNGNTPIHKALNKDHQDLVYIFLLHGPVKSKVHDTLLHTAAKKGLKQLILFLIEKGININSQDEDGETPLHYAARKNRPEIINLLLDHGAQINVQDNVKDTPLHIAAMRGHEPIIQLLLQKGAFVNSINNEGMTPLHYAISNSDEDDENTDRIVKLFLDHGADVSIQDKKGNTPLHYAIKKFIEYNEDDEDDDVLAQSKRTIELLLAPRKWQAKINLFARQIPKLKQTKKSKKRNKTALELMQKAKNEAEKGGEVQHAKNLQEIIGLLKTAEEEQQQAPREKKKLHPLLLQKAFTDVGIHFKN